MAVRIFHIDAGEMYPLLNKEMAQTILSLVWGRSVERFITSVEITRCLYDVWVCDTGGAQWEQHGCCDLPDKDLLFTI